MKISRNEFRTQAFVVTKDILVTLLDTFAAHIGHTVISVECTDGLTREFRSLAELDAFDNPKRKAIKKLSLRAYSPDLRTSASLRLDSDARSNVYIALEGDDVRVEPVNEILENQLEAMRPWYAPVATADATGWLLAALGILIVALFGGAVTGLLHPRAEPVEDRVRATYLAAVALAGLAPLVLGTILNRAKAVVFPASVFALGQGAKRFHDKDLIRNLLVVGFAVSFLASIVSAWFI